MRKFGIQLFVFFLVLGSIVFIVTRFDNAGRCQNKNANVQKLVCMSSFDSLDILFLGNSYCYSGINTACFDSAGIRTFNLGVSSCGVNFYRALVNDYITSVSTKPKSVFILISPMILSSKADDAMNNPIYRYLNDPISNENYLFFYDNRLLSSYPKICARSISRSFVGAYTWIKGKENYCKDRAASDMFRTKGWIPSEVKNSLKNELKTDHFYKPLLKDQFNNERATNLMQLAGELNAKGIKVVFYELPSNKLYTFFNEEYKAAYKKFLSEMCATYLYLYADVKPTPGMYRDQDHLNTAGSILACRNLIEQLKTQAQLKELYFSK